MSITNLKKSNLFGYLLVILLLVLLFLSLSLPLKEIRSIRLFSVILVCDFGISFVRVSSIAFLAWISAIFCGYVISHSQFVHKLLLPVINFIRHISPFAWLPFAIIWFGLGEAPVAFILFITLFFPSILIAADSFHSIPEEFIDEAMVSGASAKTLFWLVELPLTIPSHIGLFRIVWGMGWTTIIAAEMLGVQSGLGFRLLDFRYLLHYAQMYYYLIIMGIAGIGVDTLIQKTLCRVERILFTEKSALKSMN
jgi:NitT/TauT family transport system permease protein